MHVLESHGLHVVLHCIVAVAYGKNV